MTTASSCRLVVRRQVRRLNVDGDGQADLELAMVAEHRVYVYDRSAYDTGPRSSDATTSAPVT